MTFNRKYDICCIVKFAEKYNIFSEGRKDFEQIFFYDLQFDELNIDA